MITIGLTGSIGMGKSTAAAMLRRMGVPVHDADKVVHAALVAGGAAVDAVLEAFPGCGDGQGGIDRAALRAQLGMEPARWTRLEEIIHPIVRSSEARFIALARAEDMRMVALDIPLLFETGAEARLDRTICLTAPPFIQRLRLRRRGLDPADAAFRLARQLPDAEKRRRADFVVQTGLGRGYTFAKLRRIVRSLAS